MKPQAETTSIPFQTNTPNRPSSLSFKLQQYQQQKQATPKAETTLKQEENFDKSKINEIFYKKKFKIMGFDYEERESIEKILIQKGALILQSEDADLTEMTMDLDDDQSDFALFPLISSTPLLHKNPVTVYWIKKCCESNQLLPIQSDIFFQPIPRYNTDTALSDCVITISGYGQYEKDNIANLCKLLGAHTQPSLSLKKTNEIQVNTHLICKQAIGPKYIAAKTWNLPIVCAEWVIECCVTGMKADEKKYSVENQELIHKDLVEALAKIRQQNENMCTNSSYNSKPSKSINFSTNEPEYNHNDSSLSMHNESKKPRLDDDSEKNAEISFKTCNDLKFKIPNQSPALIHTPKNPRLKEIRRSEIVPQPISPSIENNKFSTPVWMKSVNGIDFKFKNLDCDKALEMLKTPESFNKTKCKKPETPLCELFTNAIHIAAEKSKNSEYWANCYESPAFEYSFQRSKRENLAKNQDQSDLIQPTPRHTRLVLKSCKVYVSRKLAKIQTDLYKIVESLGGDFCWTYNSDVTHFIYSGDIGDNVKELKIAIQDQKLIVLPDWIYACNENQTHLDEHGYLLVSKNNLDSEEASEMNEISGEESNTNQTEIENKEKQIDIKRAFLDQLQDKLASLKSVNTSRKISRNKSDINKSDLTEFGENRTNFDDETALLQNFEYNQMNDKNEDFDLNDDEDNSKRRQTKRKAIPSTSDDLQSTKNCDEQSSPSLLGKEAKKNHSNAIPHSQIQVTYWKDDSGPMNMANLAPTQNKMNTRQKNGRNETNRAFKADAIAERIMTAARAAKKN